MRTLLIVKDRHVARSMGCGITCQHKANPDLLFWWPAQGAQKLQGLQVDMLVMDRPARRDLSNEDWAVLRPMLYRRDMIAVGDL